MNTKRCLMTRLETMQVEIAPFWVDTWSPGDGMTRYRFFAHKHSRGTPSVNGYFGPDNGIWTALGYGDACTFAAGLVQGMEVSR